MSDVRPPPLSLGGRQSSSAYPAQQTVPVRLPPLSIFILPCAQNKVHIPIFGLGERPGNYKGYLALVQSERGCSQEKGLILTSYFP